MEVSSCFDIENFLSRPIYNYVHKIVLHFYVYFFACLPLMGHVLPLVRVVQSGGRKRV
jgi:hypothetical protein